MLKKIVNFIKSSFKSTPLSSTTMDEEIVSESFGKIVEMEQSVEKKKRTKKKTKSDESESTTSLTVVD